MTQKFDGIKLEFTFREFGIQTMISQTLKNNMKVSSMIFKIFGIDQNIVDKITTNLSSSGMKTEFMRYMKYAGALVRSKDITRYS
jgi:hypothetical protein